MHLSVFTPSFTVAGMSTMGTESATVRENGLITIPQSSLSFQPVEVQVNLPDASSGSSGATGASSPAVVTVQAVATSDFSGGLDPANGSAFLVGNFELLWSSSTTMNNCTVGPFRVVTRSNAQGAIAYSSNTGSVTMVDPGFTINAIPGSAAGCGGNESAINNALALPVTTTTTRRTNRRRPRRIPRRVRRSRPSSCRSRSRPPLARPHRSRSSTISTRPPRRDDHTTAVCTSDLLLAASEPEQRHPLRRAAGGGVTDPESGQPQGQHNPKKTKPEEAGEEAGESGSRSDRRWSGPRRHPEDPAAPRRTPGEAQGEEGDQDPTGRQLSFVPAAFVKRSPSALATGLNLAGLLGLLVFSSLALWLVTSELSEFKAGARRQRMHRIAGVTDNR